MTLFKNNRSDLIDRYHKINDYVSHDQIEIKKYDMKRANLKSEFDKKRLDAEKTFFGYGCLDLKYSLKNYFIQREKIYDEEKLDFLLKNEGKLDKNYFIEEVNYLKNRINNTNSPVDINYEERIENSYNSNDQTILKKLEENN